MELEVLPEHGDQVLLEPHHQRVDPGVEDDVGTLEPHLRRIPGRKILDVHRRRDHRAGNTQPLGNVALHLGAQHQFRVRFGNLGLYFQIIVRDERLDAVALCRLAHVASEFSGVGTQAHNGKAKLFRRNARCGYRVRRVGEDEDALAREIGRIHGPRVPGHSRPDRIRVVSTSIPRRDRPHVRNSLVAPIPIGHRLDRRLTEHALQPVACLIGQLRIDADVEVGLRNTQQILGRRAERRDHIDIDPDRVEQSGDLDDIVATPEPERGRTEQIRLADAHPRRATHARAPAREPGSSSRPRIS